MCSLHHKAKSTDECCDNVQSDTGLLQTSKTSLLGAASSFIQPHAKTYQDSSIEKSSSISNLHSSSGGEGDVGDINFSSLSIDETKIVLKNDNETKINNSGNDGSVFTAESQAKQVLDSSTRLSNLIDNISNSFVNIKRYFKKKNTLFSSGSDSSFSEHEVIQGISEDPIDRYISNSEEEEDYHGDSNSSQELPSNESSSFSDREDIQEVSKSSIEVVSADITTSEEERDDGGVTNSSQHLPNKLDGTSISNIKYNFKNNKPVFSSRSNPYFSNREENKNVLKDPVDVIRIHRTTSDEEEKVPSYDLDSHLNKNIRASTECLNYLFLKSSQDASAKIPLPTHSSNPNHTSFLLSLTPEVPHGMCHPGAVKYRGISYSKHKNELAHLLFKLFNKEIFAGKLPPLEIKWSDELTTTAGVTKCSFDVNENKNGKMPSPVIQLARTATNDASKVRDALLHELCHAANLWIDGRGGGHGPLFDKWVDKIWKEFPEIPKVKTTYY
ncbi:unnamed protein product [Nezara viridula]|uniref:SprT-like domain-containing protein n=1 Tax=Nezara viridula TaxID=85310 RepID=A0A9P0E6D0_NEZVI|nr:unnamed protein product [Nezara viridula]